MKVAILISGSGSNMVALVEAMREGRVAAEPVLVLCNRPDRRAFEAQVQKALERAEAELICLAGFMRILTADFLNGWQGRVLNIHPSLLPLYPGLDTHARALAAGDAEAGCTVHLVTAQLDGGPILAQARVPVLAGDTPDTLAARVLAEEHRLYPRTLAAYVSGR